MFAFFVHCYNYAEIYTLLLFPVVVTLGIWAFYVLLRDHGGVFEVVPETEWEEESTHG
jgi:hypothetical protein